MEYELYTILFIGGLMAGLFGSTVGSAGLLSIPLLFLTGLPAHSVIATNRMAAVFLESGSIAKFHRAKKINFKLGLSFGLLASLGSAVGSRLILEVDERHLKLLIAILLLVVLITLIFKKKLGLKEKKIHQKHWIMAGMAVFVLGIYGGFFGVGFGTFVTFIFLLIGPDFIKSAAISRLVGWMMSLTATVSFALADLIHYPYALTLGAGLALGGWTGAGLGLKKGNAYIKWLFIVMIGVSIAKLLYEFFK